MSFIRNTLFPRNSPNLVSADRRARCACSTICPPVLPGWPRGRAGARARFQREGLAGHVVKGTEVESLPLKGSSVCGGAMGCGQRGRGRWSTENEGSGVRFVQLLVQTCSGA